MPALNQSSPPRAEGDLSRTPFAHLLLYLYREGLSGTLVIDRGGYESKVLFRNGRAVAARPIPRGAGLQDGLLELCALAEGAYGFWDGDLVDESAGSGEASGVIRGTVDPYSFVAESLRGHSRDVVITSVVDRYRGVRLRLLPDADLKRLGLRGPEARLVEQLRSTPRLTDDFIERSEVTPAEARKLLYLLLITKHVVVEGGDTSNSSGVRSAINTTPPMPGRRNSVTPHFGTPIPQRLPTAPPGAAAPRSPSSSGMRAPQPGSIPTTPGIPSPSVHARPGSGQPPSNAPLPAWQQLATSLRPGSTRPSGGPPVPSASFAPPPIEYLDDAGKLRRAEQYVARNNIKDAERIVDDLIASDPQNADFHAMRAFVLYHQFVGDRPSRPLVEAVERALRLNEEHGRALFVKGLILNRMGKRNDAIRYFQRALDADPRNIDAERELRLARMRRDR